MDATMLVAGFVVGCIAGVLMQAIRTSIATGWRLVSILRGGGQGEE